MGISSQFSSGQIITSSIEHDAILEPCKKLNLKGFLVNQNISDGYELTNLKHQIFGLTGRKVYGAIPYNPSFTIESYVENFSNFVDVSNLGLENI